MQEADCFMYGKRIRASLYEREKLRAGEQFCGPAIITEYSATSIVLQGWKAKVDAYGQIHLSNRLKNNRHHVR